MDLRQDALNQDDALDTKILTDDTAYIESRFNQ